MAFLVKFCYLSFRIKILKLINLFKAMIVFVLFIASVIPVDAASLKFVKSFDTGTDDFLFMAIKGAAISKNRDIYVVDYRGCYIARFDWNGGLIKKLGQRGQGNGDLPREKILQCR
jgi:hypothetical protein